MKKTTCFLGIILCTMHLFGQDVAGQWNGVLKLQGASLRLVFHIEKTSDGKYSATMDSPDQRAKGIPATDVSFEEAVLKIAIANIQMTYEGRMSGDSLVGTLKQAGMALPLNFSRKEIPVTPRSRPQNPEKPYPYREEVVSFENVQAKISLAGTLTLPSQTGIYPAVVLISGSGPQNRDGEMFGHKSFLVLADYLTRHGIAVLRFDDRGVAASEGNLGTATSADFATDVQAAVNYLLGRKEIDKRHIGLIGHSEGGMIAAMVAAKSNDVDFIVSLAGSGIPGDQILLLQKELIGKAVGMNDDLLQQSLAENKGAFEIIKTSSDIATLKPDLTNYYNQLQKENPLLYDGNTVAAVVLQLASPWMRFFIKYDPADDWRKVKCPVLALNGSKDLQVPPKENLKAIKESVEQGGNKKVSVYELEGFNHLFQTSATGLPNEYDQIEETFSPNVLPIISLWILNQVK